MKTDLVFAAHIVRAQNKLVFKVDIQEFMSSDSCDFLPQPGIKVRDLVQRISQLCSNPVNTCFVLSDGTYHAHKELMAASCEHFNILLNGDFSEANQLKRKRENDDKQGSDMLAIEAPDKLGTMLLEETDGAMPEHCQCTLPNRSTSVALPNFS